VDALAGALDCDIGFSPLSNTMPVLRHDMHREPGRVEFLMAWVSVPDCPFTRWLSAIPTSPTGADGAWVPYESLEGSEVAFTRDLEFDAWGRVRLYPGLGRRIG
jgi:uncharacterized protein